MEYLEKMLGVSVKYHRWKGELELPYYITERYEMRLVELDEMKCIFLWPKDKLSQIVSLKKQLRRIQMEEALPVVFIMDMTDAYRRTAFIKAHISFIVPDSQIYLPFMGTCLEEKYRMEIQSAETLQPSTQLLLFYWAYREQKRLYMNEAVKSLGLSAMTVTRAFRQLEETGLFTVGKEKVQKYLEGDLDTEALLEAIEKYLESPVSEILYISRSEAETADFLVAGESALYKQNFRNEEPPVPCTAVFKKKSHLSGSKVFLDAASQTKVELWKYNPDILANNGIVDPLSLALSMGMPVLSFWKK